MRPGPAGPQGPAGAPGRAGPQGPARAGPAASAAGRSASSRRAAEARRGRSGAAEVHVRLAAYVPLFRGCRRVLHAECGQGELLLALAADGTGTYGVTTDVEAAADALGGTLDMQAADPVDHLRLAAPESVDGLFASLLTAPLTATDLVALLTAASEPWRHGRRW